MKAHRKPLLVTVLLTLTTLLSGCENPTGPHDTQTQTSLHVSPHGRDARRFSEIVVFGNSLSDHGNVLLLTGGFAAAPPFYEGRFSNGPTWVDVLADELALPRPTASEAGGKNYAFGGAQTGPGFAVFFPIIPNLGTQIDDFLANGHELKGRELIIIRGGANDLIVQALIEPPEEVVFTPENAVANIGDHVRTLASAGGRRFLVSNLGRFADIPFLRINGVTEDAMSWQEEFNELLPGAMAELQRELGVSIHLFDAARVARKLFERPAAFGLTNLSDPACPGCGIGTEIAPDAGETIVANPDEYYYWDLVHPTRIVHAIFGRAAAKVIKHRVISHRRGPAGTKEVRDAI